MAREQGVEAERRFIAGQRLDVIDDPVARPRGSRQRHAIVQFAHRGARLHFLQGSFEGRPLAMLDEAQVAGGQHIRVARQQRRDETAEFLAAGVGPRHKQLVDGMQAGQGTADAFAQHEGARLHALLEGELGALRLQPADAGEQGAGQAEAAQQRQRRRAGAERLLWCCVDRIVHRAPAFALRAYHFRTSGHLMP